ncbi:MAG: AAA family ATPase [Pyrobaculum sp.]|jgi:KaiC/GvpD/RAD55 family RecA-like ATPase
MFKVSSEGLTLIYGPPGAGKTTLAVKIASEISDKILWISTTESPKFLKKIAARLGADLTKFNFLDFPRAFREDIIKYIIEHIYRYEALVIDSINGISYSLPNLEKLAHSVLYQISQERPVVLVSEEGSTKLHYISDHIFHIWYRKNSLGHIIRYLQLEKSRSQPPSPRYLIEFLEDGIFYVYTKEKTTSFEIVYDPHLNAKIVRGGELCIAATDLEKLLRLLQEIKNKSIFIQIGPLSIFKRLGFREEELFTVKTFQDLFKLIRMDRRGLRYLVVSGFLNLNNDEVLDYEVVLSTISDNVDSLIYVEEDLKKLNCLQTLQI